MIEILTWPHRALLQDVVSFILIAAAFVWGGGPERAAAAVWLIAFKIGGAFKQTFWTSQSQLLEVDSFLASQDFIAGFFWIMIALYANRSYTLWIAAMQILAMMGHIARGLTESVSPLGYAIMTVGPGWFQLLFLGIGLAWHIKRRRRHGAYRDWRIHRGWLSQHAGHPIAKRFFAILGHDFFAGRNAR